MAGLAAMFGSGAMTNSIDEIEDAEVIFVIGSNTTEQHPLIASRIVKAVAKGAKLIVADPRKTQVAKLAGLYLSLKAGSDVALLNGMMNYIISEGLYDKHFVETRTEGFEELKTAVADCTPQKASEITGIPVDDIIQAAKTYAGSKKSTILYCMGVTQHTTGVDNVMSVGNPVAARMGENRVALDIGKYEWGFELGQHRREQSLEDAAGVIEFGLGQEGRVAGNVGNQQVAIICR